MSVKHATIVSVCLLYVSMNVGAQAQIPSPLPPPAPAKTPALPPALAQVFGRAQVPLDSVSVIVKEAGSADMFIAHNIDKAMNPASVIKLVTTYAGLELLGPAFTWKTEVLVTGDIRAGTLHGDLVLKGAGDPKFTVERFWLLLRQLRERGLANIKGDLLLDRGAFEAISDDPAKFDGEPLKAYNVGADPLLLNFKTVRFHFAPAIDGKSVTISPDLKPAQLDIVNRVKLTGNDNNGICGEWIDRITLDVQTISATQLKVSFTGNYPRACGERSWSISLLDHPRFVGGAFAQMWRDLGGIWNGAVKLAPTPADARLIATTESPPLADVIRDINKFSNNVMARQLFLTLSIEAGKEPASVARSNAVIRELLLQKNISAPELVIENGSGLSRIDRVSAKTLAQLLDSVWRSNVMPEYVSSLALYGVDGTFRRRNKNDGIVGQAHLKSGTLNDVRALAGYVLDTSGRHWIVVLIVNHPNAGATRTAQDALLAWVHAGAR